MADTYTQSYTNFLDILSLSAVVHYLDYHDSSLSQIYPSNPRSRRQLAVEGNHSKSAPNASGLVLRPVRPNTSHSRRQP